MKKNSKIVEYLECAFIFLPLVAIIVSGAYPPAFDCVAIYLLCAAWLSIAVGGKDLMPDVEPKEIFIAVALIHFASYIFSSFAFEDKVDVVTYATCFAVFGYVFALERYHSNRHKEYEKKYKELYKLYYDCDYDEV